jgi:hypothetical protein
VHGEVYLAVHEGPVHLAGERAFAAQFRQRARPVVGTGLDAPDLNLGARDDGGGHCADGAGLRHGHRGRTRPEDQLPVS